METYHSPDENAELKKKKKKKKSRRASRNDESDTLSHDIEEKVSLLFGESPSQHQFYPKQVMSKM